jgi:hypothetical protein
MDLFFIIIFRMKARDNHKNGYFYGKNYLKIVGFLFGLLNNLYKKLLKQSPNEPDAMNFKCKSLDIVIIRSNIFWLIAFR